MSRIREFRVIARSSTFTLKGKSQDVRDVSKSFDARYVVEGSVRKAGNRLRVTAQLIDGDTGHHLWAHRYDRELDDIFVLQDELTKTLVGAIEPELSKHEQHMAKARPPESLGAWDLYQRGMWHLYSSARTTEDVIEARNLFLRATKLDPGFGPAHSGVAETYALSALVEVRDENPKEAYEFARKGVELDPSDANAHYTMGRVHFWVNRDPVAAIPDFQTALSLNPSFALVENMLARCCAHTGRAEDAILHAQNAIRLSPQSPLLGVFYAAIAQASLFLGQYDQAVEWSRKAVRYPTTPWPAHIFLVSALGHLGLDREARIELDALIELRPGFDMKVARFLLPLKHTEFVENMLDGLRKAGLPE